MRAARSIPAADLSMQAVADVLGVDRSAINHHVKGRDQLVRLVAEATFVDGFHDVDLDGTWEELSHRHVRSYVDALLGVGSLAPHVNGHTQLRSGLRASEALLRSLTEAGLSEECAVRYLVLLGYIARVHALDRIGAEHEQAPSRAESTQRSLAEVGAEEFPILDRISLSPFDTYGDQQLTFAVDVAITGLSAMLPRSQR